MTEHIHIHFIGIGGIGVSALAQLSAAQGNSVSGSDICLDVAANPALARLVSAGAALYGRHAEANIGADVSLVVSSAAISADNPELAAAADRSIRVVTRAEYLGELMSAHRGPKIAVGGTHGKTTTTGMIGVMLQHAGLDPTVFVGGEINQLGGNVRIGSSTGPFVAEACEAYDSFLKLYPDIAVITNIEADHLDFYGNIDGVMASFHRFVSNVPESGSIVACMDDPGVRRLESEREGAAEFYHYGIEFGIDTLHGVRFADKIHEGANPSFEAYLRDDRLAICLQVPGKHNVQNALAALVVGSILNLSASQISEGLNSFAGATRRQELLGTVNTLTKSVTVIDDYAHHPTEIAATLEAIKSAYPGRRVVAVFQPHLYSRTRDFMQGFAESLAAADVLLVTAIYPAREAPIPGVRASEIVHLASTINRDRTSVFVPAKQDIPSTVAALTEDGDITVFLGAGDIRDQALAFVSLLRRNAASGAQ